MQFVAKAKNVRFSPFKLRPLADVIRGKQVEQAIRWLATYPVKRTVPIKKVIESAKANAKNNANVSSDSLIVKEIRIDHGRSYRYFKPGAQGRSNVYKRRLSHISVVLEDLVKNKKNDKE